MISPIFRCKSPSKRLSSRPDLIKYEPISVFRYDRQAVTHAWSSNIEGVEVGAPGEADV